MTEALPETHQRFLNAAQSIVQGRVSTSFSVRQQHANALTLLETQLPDAVIWPETTEEVSQLIALAAEHSVPLIAFGGGTSLEGHLNAPFGGVSLDLSRMNAVLAVRPEDMDCTVQAGVTLDQLRAELRATGLFFAVDPGAGQATLGGMAATRASGTTTLRYGSMRDNVIAMTAVLASGEIIGTSRRARKSSAGYDLTRLLIGSEGTLAIITELTLRLHGIPETIVAAVAGFATLEGACRSAIQAIQSGLCVARVELLDNKQIECVNAASKLQMTVQPTLFVEFHGSASACRADFETFSELAELEGGVGVASATGDEERRKLWHARHDAFWSVKSMWPGREMVVTDAAVPLSHLAACVGETARDIEASDLKATLLGHVGDGNFHAIIAIDGKDPAELQRLEGFMERLVARAHAVDGTATGEHGIGQRKRDYMDAEHGSAVAIMRHIKHALDPLAILNPGKIF